MDKTYCGKSCELCAQREQLDCPGCRSQTQHCEIARCCLGKGHQTCETCEFRRNCRKLLRKEKVPAHRLMERARAAQKEEELARRAPIMAKWLWLLLWINVPSLIFSLLGEIESLVWLDAAGNFLCSLLCCWMLLQMKSVHVGYGDAALYTAIGVVAKLIAGFIPNSGLSLLLLTPAAAVSLRGAYIEYQTHGDVVGEVDAALGEQWRKLWKWQIIAVGSMLGGVVVMLLSPLLGALVVFAAALAAAAVIIMTMINLYKSAQVFRKIANQQKETEL